eukprot:11738392-Alexandrium_andersonii.AAC.1
MAAADGASSPDDCLYELSRDLSAIMAAGSLPARFHIGSPGITPDQEEETPPAGSRMPLPEAAGPRDKKRERDGGPTTSSPASSCVAPARRRRWGNRTMSFVSMGTGDDRSSMAEDGGLLYGYEDPREE